MGVPLRRPAGCLGREDELTREFFIPDMFCPTWQIVFRFCTVPDLGKCLGVSKSWWIVADSHHTWKYAYDRTQRVDPTSEPAGEGCLRTLIERPFGEDALGWRVAVLLEDGTDRYATGRIVSYNGENDEYLVSYDGEDGIMMPTKTWEQERRKRTEAMRHNPSLAGRSRFSFLAPPGCATCPRRALEQSEDGVMGTEGMSGCLSSSSTRRVRSWKQELENNVRNTPSRFVRRLDQHTDEVLFVAFSPCSTRLASCSRDLRTMIMRVRQDPYEIEEDSDGWPSFEVEAVFSHQTAPCRAIWWPEAPFTTVVVSTEDAGWQSASKVEIWEILPLADGDSASGTPLEGGAVRLGVNSRCIFQGQNRPFDIYAAIFPWPFDDDPYLCFAAGWAVFRESEHYVQWLNVWPGPQHPRFRSSNDTAGMQRPSRGTGQIGDAKPIQPLARLRLERRMNYLHCLEMCPMVAGQRILVMTGSTPHLCDEVGIIDLSQLQRREGIRAVQDHTTVPHFDPQVDVKSMGERVVLSAKWNQRGDLILLNTRPYARGSQSVSPASEPSFEELLSRPAPDLSTSLELLVLDARTLDTVGIFDGHFAFTTKESPFLIFTDEWADSDFLASGGEDHRVYVWHRRHRRLLQRLCGHTQPVNAVSWNGNGLLASASDDHSIIIWGAGCARHRS
eukprot:TRINITY_DN27473_c0_g1_i1.p1 TRINITY_DN27473_c0_g1~~TRINITY_DN27473_c0_g1_i1.p1  ORF type:complete len:673 (+),score=69.93 TRINITY_DN27473_c0_g1_i1:84-2102(+)